MILHVNEKHPETYLSAGIKNAVNAFFKSTGDDDTEAREMIVRMVKEGRTAMWLEGMGISVDPRMLTGPVEQAIIRVTEGKKLKSAPRRETRKRRPCRGAGTVGVNSSEVEQPASEPAEVSAYVPNPTEEAVAADRGGEGAGRRGGGNFQRTGHASFSPDSCNSIWAGVPAQRR